MEKAEKLKEISELASFLNDSIEQRGGQNKIVYNKNVSDFLNSQLNSRDFKEWSQDLSVSETELNYVLEYMASLSFISAWYHLTGDKAKRDKAAHSCSTVISSLGKDPEKVMMKYLEFERFWRQVMKDEGVAPRNLRLLGFILLTIFIIILIVLIF